MAAAAAAATVSMTPLQFLPWEIKTEDVGHLCVPRGSCRLTSVVAAGQLQGTTTGNIAADAADDAAAVSGCLLQPRACACADAAKATNRSQPNPTAGR
jgi:hypothetical protein